MRNIYKIFACFILGLALVACDDGNDAGFQYMREKSISVESQNLYFESVADSGSVVIKSETPFTVKSTASWVTTQINDNTINVYVTQNASKEGRSAKLIVMNEASDSVNVVVQQEGFVLRPGSYTFNLDDDPHEFATKLTTSFDNVDITTSSNDITAVLDGDSLRISVTGNDTRKIRPSYVYFSSGSAKDTLTVIQSEFSKDIAGEWTMTYYDSMNLDNRVTSTATLSKDGFELHLAEGDFMMPALVFSDDSLTISFCNRHGYPYEGGGYYFGNFTFSGEEGNFYQATNPNIFGFLFFDYTLVYDAESSSFTGEATSDVFLLWYTAGPWTGIIFYHSDTSTLSSLDDYIGGAFFIEFSRQY